MMPHDHHPGAAGTIPYGAPTRRAAAITFVALPLSACTGAPAISIVGSYFPDWMLCTLLGITAAVCLRQVFVLVGLENSLVAPLLTHALVALAVTLAVWLLWFGH